MSSFWSGWIIVLTVATIIGLFWLLFGNRTRPNTEEKTTGHVYDGIEEYDNPLPAWWLYMFVISMVFAIGYLVIFPGLGNFKGVIGWTQVGQWEKENENMQPCRLRNWQKMKKHAAAASVCSLPIAPRVTDLMRAATQASPTCVTRTGSMVDHLIALQKPLPKAAKVRCPPGKAS